MKKRNSRVVYVYVDGNFYIYNYRYNDSVCYDNVKLKYKIERKSQIKKTKLLKNVINQKNIVAEI